MDYLQVEIKKNVNALKESMTKRLTKMSLSRIMKIQLMMIWVMLNSAIDDAAATTEILLEHAKKNIFWVVNFVFIK